MHGKGTGVMSKGYIYLALVAMVLAGCQTKEKKTLTDGLPPVVGGTPIECLVGEKEGAPVLGVKFDEIVLSNGQVTITGTFSGFPDRRLTLDPTVFWGDLACTILSAPEIERPFRLVGDDEFILKDYPSTDWVFKSSSLFAGGDRLVRFSYSYKGFPSDAEVRGDKDKMNIISKFGEKYEVDYYMQRFIDVRFADQSYEYPNEAWSWVNIKGEGRCIMRVYKDEM